jgi:polyhydroxyalkanoate synthesis regulator phasin
MKTVLVVIILIAVVLSAGYFGLPVLIEKKTAGLSSDVQALKQKLEKIDEESRIAPLPPTSDTQKITKVVNSLSSKVTALEDSFNKAMSVTDEAIKKQKTATEQASKKQIEAIDRITKDTEAKIHRSMFYALIATIRGNVLKVKLELAAKNVGTARNDLELISGTFEKAKTLATEENRKVIDELQGILKKARGDIDTDLPSAINRIDLLWNEMSKVLLKA